MDEGSPREVLLKHGRWVGATEFARLVANERNVSERQAKTLISKAYLDHKIKKHIFPDRTVIYGLSEFGPPTSEVTHGGLSKLEVESVKKVLDELRCEFRFLKEPTVKKVACRVGMRPEIVESVLYELAPKTGWEEPNENAEKMAEDVINLAGWLCWKRRNEQNPQMQALADREIGRASKETLRRAQRIVENYPDLAPSVSLQEIVWPKKTKEVWTEVFGSEAPSPFTETGAGFVSVKELLKRPAYRHLFRGLEDLL